MRLLLLGASGECGRRVAVFARERGHEVTAIVRPAAPLTAAVAGGCRVIRADVGAPGVIREALAGQDAVVSCLGLRRRAAWNPWSRLLSPADLTSRVARLTADAMTRRGVARVVAPRLALARSQAIA
ncbi:MAG: NAD(P)H-binding protein [Candidatus Schekmanbacteria bacterium]|nr:NAD(P)H-binding protein [Candidatus Schekmanbacteria bacterium]